MCACRRYGAVLLPDCCCAHVAQGQAACCLLLCCCMSCATLRFRKPWSLSFACFMSHVASPRRRRHVNSCVHLALFSDSAATLAWEAASTMNRRVANLSYLWLRCRFRCWSGGGGVVFDGLWSTAWSLSVFTIRDSEIAITPFVAIVYFIIKRFNCL